MPQGQAAAMMPFPERAGSASSFLGICQMSFAALLGLLTGQLLKGSALPLPLLTAAIGLAALAVFIATRNARAAAQPH
jgi:DHA1 family bicyclomycin/chloramphenicol resistance-like MFS transporter